MSHKLSDKPSDKPHPILPHGDIDALAPGLWSVRGSLAFPLHRNMAIWRMPDGALLLHSAIALDEAGMAKLETLGRPAVCIVPSTGHRMDAPFYRKRYPGLKVLCPEAARAKVEKVVSVDATCEQQLPALGARPHPVGGLRGGELAYELPLPDGGGKALLFCDLTANSDYAPGFMGSLMAKISGGVKGRLGVPRIVRLAMVRNRAATRDALRGLANIPDLRVISLAHGRPILDRCAEALREAAATL